MNITDVRIRNMVIAVLAILALFLLIQSFATIVGIKKQSNQMPNNSITVRGTGEAIGTPDIATFSYTVRENNKDVAAAQQAMTEKSNKAVDYLKQHGVEDRDIKTVSYNTDPQYEYVTTSIYTPGTSKLTGYNAYQTVSVKVRDTAKAGEILTGLAALQVGEVSSLSFTIDDPENLKSEAREDAIGKAKEEAERISKALGIKLKKVVSFYEEYPYDGPVEAYGGDMRMSAVKVQNAVPDLQKGEEKVTSTVSITYEVEN